MATPHANDPPPFTAEQLAWLTARLPPTGAGTPGPPLPGVPAVLPPTTDTAEPVGRGTGE